MDNELTSSFFECSCYSPEHSLRFILDKDPEFPLLYTEIYLSQYHSFLGRIWIAIKYVFGYRCRYGHWDTWILKRDDAKRLRDLADEFIRFQAEVDKKE